MTVASSKIKWTKARCAAAAVAAAYAAAIVLALIFLDLKQLHGWAGEMHGGLLVGLLAVLPLIGFPLRVLHFAVGAKFGLGLGLGLVAASILFHLAVAYMFAKVIAESPLGAWLEKKKQTIPALTYLGPAGLALLIALIPGPYILKNFVLVLCAVPFGTACLVALPVYFFQAGSGILFGDFSGGMNAGRILFLVVYAGGIALACRMLLKRVQSGRANALQLIAVSADETSSRG